MGTRFNHFAAPERPAPGLSAAALPGGQRGSVLLDGSPGYPPTVNLNTSTLYVPIQCTNSTCQTASHVVDVISAATCTPATTSGCRIVARAIVGKNPQYVVVDAQTDTLYVANSSGSVSVVDGATCNASVTTGCAKPLATIHTGGFPLVAALDQKNQTLYVASYAPNNAGRVFVIGIAQCNAMTTAGCSQPVTAIPDSADPDAIAVNPATHTVYAANEGPDGSGDTVSVINAATCDAATSTGCQVEFTATIGTNPYWIAVDQTTDTIYTANYNNGTVSVINGASCNATVGLACYQAVPTIAPGGGAAYVAPDPGLHTLFVLNQDDDTIAEINTQTCDGAVTSGCAARPRNEQATFNPAQGYNPNELALDPGTGTAYLVNGGGENYLAAVSIRACNAVNTTGCRTEAPSVPDGEYEIAADPATDTIYGGNLTRAQIDVINGAICHAGDRSGCAPVAAIPFGQTEANMDAGSIDQATHTLYASDPFGNSLAVINTATCNATHTTGCGSIAAKIKIGAYPGAPEINAATDTLYVPYGTQANKIAVVNAATCNSETTAGCGQTPAVIRVKPDTFQLAVSIRTDTIYAPNTSASYSGGDTVAVLNGATCDGTTHSGCRQVAATVKVGSGPIGVAVNDATNTVYVANNANGDLPGTVSVINGAACNGMHTAGCKQHVPSVVVGRSPLLVAVDTRTNTVYVSDYSSAAVSVLNGTRCDASTTSGCRSPAYLQPVGSQPFGIAIDQGTSTVYVTDLFQSGSTSIFKAR